jgi:hypothetical protein
VDAPCSWVVPYAVTFRQDINKSVNIVPSTETAVDSTEWPFAMIHTRSYAKLDAVILHACRLKRAPASLDDVALMSAKKRRVADHAPSRMNEADRQLLNAASAAPVMETFVESTTHPKNPTSRLSEPVRW